MLLGVVVGRLLGVHLGRDVDGVHLLVSLLVMGRGPVADPQPPGSYLPGVVDVHVGEPGEGIHGEVVTLVQCRHLRAVPGADPLCP